MMAAALALLRVVPLRGWLIIGAIIVALGGALYFRQHFINQGASNATSVIERANNAANQNADQAETDYYQRFDQCRSAGGSWDRANRLCLTGSGDKALRRDPR
ncbi:hypothetical protein [Labrys neptuniae]